MPAIKRNEDYSVENIYGNCDALEGGCMKWKGKNDSRHGRSGGRPILARRGADERIVYRWLWKRLRPTEDINGWSLTQKCSTQFCCNPDHYFKGVFNGGKYLKPE